MTPEKAVQIEMEKYLKRNGFSCQVFDSKAVYSRAIGCYQKSRGMQEGIADLLGSDPYGNFVAIELKAPGKETVCRLRQWMYLHEKIKHNCFAIVASAPIFVFESHAKWLTLRKDSPETAQKFLLTLLPVKVQVEVGRRKLIVAAPSLTP